MSLKRLFRVATACLVGLTLYVGAHGDWTRDTPRFLAFWGFLSASYLGVLFSAGTFRKAVEGADQIPPKDLMWALVLLAAVRVVLAFGEPLLSDDVYRSVWEGRVQRASGNPFAWTDRPEAAKWAGLRDAQVFPRINHPDYAAVYPPAWQWAMRGVNALSDSVTAVKLFAVGCELFFWFGLVELLSARGLPRSRVLVAAASPLALIEISGSGHGEAMGMAALVWTLVHLHRSAQVRASAALSIAVLSKLVPAVLAIPWLRRFRIRDYGVMVAIAALLSAPFADETALWSLQKYGDYWRFNETFFAITAALGGTHRGGIVLSALLLVTLGLFLDRRHEDVVRSGLVMTVALLLLIPNVLPWYALWLLVFLPPANPSPLALGALVFTLTAPVAYLVYPDWLGGERWQLSWPVRVIEYGLPALAAAAFHRSGPRAHHGEAESTGVSGKALIR